MIFVNPVEEMGRVPKGISLFSSYAMLPDNEGSQWNFFFLVSVLLKYLKALEAKALYRRKRFPFATPKRTMQGIVFFGSLCCIRVVRNTGRRNS